MKKKTKVVYVDLFEFLFTLWILTIMNFSSRVHWSEFNCKVRLYRNWTNDAADDDDDDERETTKTHRTPVRTMAHNFPFIFQQSPLGPFILTAPRIRK